jgi:aryl-alcohol dehydrogenase-like predicted oxidoreductase
VLGLDAIPVVHLRYSGHANVPFHEALQTMIEMRDDGMLQNIGLSNVTAEQLQQALEVTPIATVSNMYGVLDRRGEDVLALCEEHGIAFLPFFPLAAGKQDENADLVEIAREIGSSPAQVALAWSLRHSPMILPIPGTSRVSHLEENVAAVDLDLSDDILARLDAISQPTDAQPM